MKNAWKTMVLSAGLALLLSGCSHFTDLVEKVAEKQETTAAEAVAVKETEIPEDQVVEPRDADALHIELSKDASALGFVHLMEEATLGTSEGNYDFEVKSSEAEVLSDFITGAADVAVLSPASAARAYHDAKDGAVVLNIDAGNALYCLTGNSSITSFQSLKGQEVLSVGEGEQPEYVLQYLLSQYGTTMNIRYTSLEDITAQLTEDPTKVAIVPEPAASQLLAQIPGLGRAFSLNDSWENVAASGTLVSGITLVHRTLYETERSTVDNLLRESATSIVKAGRVPEQTGKLAEKFGIAQAATAQATLPYAGLGCVTGDTMKSRISTYLINIASVDSAAVGRSVPGEDFYYGYVVENPEESTDSSREDGASSSKYVSDDTDEDDEEEVEDDEHDTSEKRSELKKSEEDTEKSEKKEKAHDAEKPSETEKKEEKTEKAETGKHAEAEPPKPAETPATVQPRPAAPDPSAAPAGPSADDDLISGGPMDGQ